MKIKLFRKGLLVLAFCLVVSPAVFAQTGTVTLNLNGVSVKVFLSKIEEQSSYKVSYRDAEIPEDHKVSIKVKDALIKDVLTSELAKAGLNYSLVGDKIVVSPAKQASARKSDPILVKGTVVDENGLAVIGATVMINGTSNGTVTDAEGKYSISARRGEELVFVSLGYETHRMPVGSSPIIDITLYEDKRVLDEAVVIGYGTTTRKNLTTSISTVKAEDISTTSNSNITQALLGKAAGLRATLSSSQPGGAVDISIRGGGTPTYVVDGIVMPSGSLEVGNGTIETPNSINRAGLAGLNPGDIESVEVLKDAAASIYGIGAANGVILITTKKGIDGTPRISLETNYSFVRNYDYLEPLNAQEYMNFANVFNKESYLYNHQMAPYGVNTYDGKWSPQFTPADLESAQTTNWLDYILRNGSITNNTVTINGGTKYVKYYLSGNYFNQVGTVINSRMERYTLRSNLSAQVFPFMTVNAIMNINSNNYTNSNADGGGAGGVGKDALQTALMFPPNYGVYDSEGNIQRYRNSIANPSEMERYNDNTKSTGWYVNTSADIKLYKDILAIHGVFGYNSENAKRSLYIPTDMMYYEITGVSRGHVGDSERSNRTIEATLTYKQNIKNVVTLDAVLGCGWYTNKGTTLELDYKNANDLIAADNVGAAEGPFYPTSSRYENEKRSQFGRISADILDRYVLAFTIRRDGTDKFFPGKKYAWFPSGSVAWKMSNEKWLNDVSWLNLLKIRASYGVTGRDNLGTTCYGVYELATNFVYFGDNTINYIPYLKTGADYPDVSWEKTKMKNVGIDFSFFNDRLWGSFDYFRNDVTDLLGTAPGEPLNMVGSRPVNYGHYYRQGWDATLNSINIKTKSGFEWDSQLTLTRYKINWVERTQNYDYAEYQKKDDEPMNAFYYYNIAGIINEDRSNMPESQRTLPEDAQMPGYYIIEDRNGDGVIDMQDIYMKDVLPSISIGFGNTFRYKDFDLEIFLYGQFGASKYNYAFTWASPGQFSYNTPQNSNQYAYGIWNSQTNKNGYIPGIAATKAVSLPGNAGTNLGWENASFVRVRNITLGYTLQGKLLGEVLSKRVENIRFYFDCQNPLTFTSFSGIDPEIYTGNSSSPVGYPMARTFTLGAKFNFK